ncbi:hypothetical protein EP331_13205 [bacterium]|nr:MAG: hypothetical protein EP331_13205 [bacterium]
MNKSFFLYSLLFIVQFVLAQGVQSQNSTTDTIEFTVKSDSYPLTLFISSIESKLTISKDTSFVVNRATTQLNFLGLYQNKPIQYNLMHLKRNTYTLFFSKSLLYKKPYTNVSSSSEPNLVITTDDKTIIHINGEGVSSSHYSYFTNKIDTISIKLKSNFKTYKKRIIVDPFRTISFKKNIYLQKSTLTTFSILPGVSQYLTNQNFKAMGLGFLFVSSVTGFYVSNDLLQQYKKEYALNEYKLTTTDHIQEWLSIPDRQANLNNYKTSARLYKNISLALIIGSTTYSIFDIVYFNWKVFDKFSVNPIENQFTFKQSF